MATCDGTQRCTALVSTRASTSIEARSVRFGLPSVILLRTRPIAEYYPADFRLILKHFNQGLAKAGRRGRHLDAGGLHGGGLVLGPALAAGDDGAGVPHAAAGRSGAPGDEADHRLLAAPLRLVGDELRRVLLGRAADLADHDDRLRPLVREEHLEHLDELGAFDGIAADADRG